MVEGPSRYDGVSLVEHFNAVLAERDKAVELAFTELARRLDILNHAHEDMRKRDALFYSKETHDAYAIRIDDEFKRVHKEITEATTPRNQFWYVGLLAAVIIGGASGLWKVAENISRIDANQQHVLNELQKHDAEMKLFETLHPGAPAPPRR
jgi:hypothetical protein